MSTQTITEIISEFLLSQPEGTASFEDIFEYVKSVRPETSNPSSVYGRLSDGCRKDPKVFEKDAAGVYRLLDFEKLKSEVAAATPEVEEAQEAIEVPELPEAMQEEHKKLRAINAAKIKGVKLKDPYLTLAKQMKVGTTLTAMFMGDPGNGKTTIARAMAEFAEMPVYSQNFSLNNEEMNIIGGFVPDVNEPGAFKWEDGQFTRAFRHGGFYIAEEPNYAKPGVLGIMNNALDGVGELVLPNGEVLQRHPHFRFIGCMNVGLAGTQRMNLAFINRMNEVFKFDPLSNHDQIQIIKKESGYSNERVIAKMVEVTNAIRNKIQKEQIDGATVSIRNTINWAKKVKSTNNIVQSAWSTMVWAVCMEDEDVQKEIFEDIVDPRMRGLSA